MEKNSKKLIVAYSMLNDTSAEGEIKELLKIYIEKNKDAHYIPLKVINAISRYSNWIEQNPEALQKAKFENLLEMHSLYNLSKLSEYLRYYMYRHTYFDDADDKLKHRFDELLDVMNINRERPATKPRCW